MDLCTILCAEGASDALGAVDQYLDGLISFMGSKSGISMNLTGMAKGIGSVLCLIVGSYECFMMMLGKRGIDVMKILRILAISLCITFSGSICSALKAPGDSLMNTTKVFSDVQYSTVKDLENDVSKMSKKYTDKLRDQFAEEKMKKDASEDRSILETLTSGEAMDELKQNINNSLKIAAATVETTLAEWINAIARWIGLIIFQVVFYSMMLGQICFMGLLQIWAPMAFALSLVPAFKSAWSQWISKYLSLSLWGFVCYYILGYVWMVVQYVLEKDIAGYEVLLSQAGGTDWADVGMLAVQQIGATAMYVVGLIIGAVLLRFVPEVASWLIPGGVSSGFGSTAAAGTTAVAAGVGSAAGATVRAATSNAAGNFAHPSEWKGSAMSRWADSMSNTDNSTNNH